MEHSLCVCRNYPILERLVSHEIVDNSGLLHLLVRQIARRVSDQVKSPEKVEAIQGEDIPDRLASIAQKLKNVALQSLSATSSASKSVLPTCVRIPAMK